MSKKDRSQNDNPNDEELDDENEQEEGVNNESADEDESDDDDKDEEEDDQPEVFPDEYAADCNEVTITLVYKNGDRRPILWSELPGERRSFYLNLMRSKTDKEGRVKDFTDVHESLLTELMSDPNDFVTIGKEKAQRPRPLTLHELHKLPSKTLDALYERAVKENALDKDAEKKAKKRLSKGKK